MTHIRARRTGSVAAALAIALTAAATPALAANPPGFASVGSADFTRGDQRVVIPALAACAVDGTTAASSEAVVGTGIRFGAGSSSCTRAVVDPANQTSTTRSEATGRDFELSALVAAGGPRLRIGSWKITCAGSQAGTDGAWSLGGLSGFTGLPQEIPANYAHQVRGGSGAVLATVTFNEVLLPEPNDGSMAMNIAHFRFAPESGVTGEVVVGATACSPTP